MTRSRYTVLKRHAPAACAALCVATVGVLAWPYSVDDAFITARYAKHLAAGLGYAMNPPEVSDGVTGPLWLVPEVIACWIGIDPITCAKSIGLICAALSAGLLVHPIGARAGLYRGAWSAAIVLALSPSVGTWAVSGLETGAATLCATVAALAVTRRPKPAGLLLGGCVACLAWLRPELACFAAVLLVFGLLRDRRAGGVAMLVAGLGAASVLLFRRLFFDAWLPLSYLAKAGSLADGAAYCVEALVLSTSLVGVAMATLGAIRGRKDDRVIGVALLLHLGAICLAGGDWMPGYRLLVPVLPLYAGLVGIGVARSFMRHRWISMIALVLCCSVPAVDLATRIPELRAAAESQRKLDAFSDWLRSNAEVVALVDVGYIGRASGLKVVDLGGLTDAAIARMPGGHLGKRIDRAYLEARNPDAIVLHSAGRPRVDNAQRLLSFDGFAVERRVASMPFVSERFRVARVLHYAPHYYYVALLRSPVRWIPK